MASAVIHPARKTRPAAQPAVETRYELSAIRARSQALARTADRPTHLRLVSIRYTKSKEYTKATR